MQTRFPFFHTISSPAQRICASILTIAILCSTAACSPARIEGRAETEQQQSPCEQSYFNAKSEDKTSHDSSQHIITRYLAANQAVSSWLDTAAYCPARFADGTLRAARARIAVRVLASKLGADVESPSLSRLDDVSGLGIDNQSLSSLADAEDQAGFVMEVFAARSIGHATLDLSDRHKTTAQRLISFAGSTDNRAKTYEIAKLLANPTTMTDASTGLNAPTDSVIEINCARREIEAIAASSGSSDSSTSKDSRVQSLKELSDMVADRAETAFLWGYPTFDDALFD